MNNYEFWDELGKIFNAVVAYQEKSTEFNKRFINPWIRLGNVFDKQDRNLEAIGTYQKAIEIDPANAQNWYELGNVYFRLDTYDESVEAYNKAIELDPESGWSYNNLALTYVTQGKYSDAIPLYQKSLELLQDQKDKAVAWNRLGNAYRKLNEYDLAVKAFQAADELDGENAGFRDELDDAPEEPNLVEAATNESSSRSLSEDLELPPSTEANGPIEGTSSQGDSQEPALNLDDPPLLDPTIAVQTAVGDPTSARDPALEHAVQAGLNSSDSATDAVPEGQMLAPDDAGSGMDAATDAGPTKVGALGGTAISESAKILHAAEEAGATGLSKERSGEKFDKSVPSAAETSRQTAAAQSNKTAAPDDIDSTNKTPAVTSSESVDATRALSSDGEAAHPIAESWRSIDMRVGGDLCVEATGSPHLQEVSEPFAEELAAWAIPAEGGDQAKVADPSSEEAAYEEFLEDNNETLNILASETTQNNAVIQGPAVVQEPVAKIDATGDIQIEVDTKNAHVWNELGNVYFNARTFEDAITAYGKAIELDRWFAWPYSNLALAYVQKGRFAEAILLYQRSIELFSSEKDKAISWNRLGNVYRRLNDYDNAISAYQRADDLDPDNTTLSLQSRFSLLGNYYAEQKPSYIS